MTKTEIIHETVEFYKNNPRSLNEEGKCVFLGPNGEKCAFSRCLKEMDFSTWGQENAYVLLNEGSVEKDDFEDGYWHEDKQFWLDLQIFHDKDEFWVKKGSGNILTRGGEIGFKRLLREYENE